MGNVRVYGIHSRKHPVVQDGCFSCKVSTLMVGSSEGGTWSRRDREFSNDQDAYKRLRADGLQPQSPQGAAEVERHQLEQIEIDYRMKLRPDHKEQLKEVQSKTELDAWMGGGVNG